MQRHYDLQTSKKQVILFPKILTKLYQNKMITLYNMLINHKIYLIQWIIILSIALTLYLNESIGICIGIIYSIMIILTSDYLLSEKKMEIIYINFTCMIFGFLLYFAWMIRISYTGFSLFLVNQILFHMGEMLHVAFYKFNLLSWNSICI